MSKLKVGILFGGKSAEHEVSLQSAKNIFDAIDRTKFDPVLIGIDKNGKWHLCDSGNFLINAADPKNIKLNPAGHHAALVPDSRGLLSILDGTDANGGETIKLDVIFPILHGPFGEDGTVQGLLKLADIPFVGSGVLGSAVGMDKDVMKRLLENAHLPIGKYIILRDSEKAPSYSEAAAKLGTPIFVKPANMGSSVGVNKIHNESEYSSYISEAFNYDTKIVLEEFIEGREIECAVLGNEDLIASLPGEIKPLHEFYSYDAKYIDEAGASLEIPAKLDEATQKKIQSLAIETYKTLCAEGLSRVDFFLCSDGKIIVNEINTMPGFTKISMYPKLFENVGISYSELITRLLELAINRYEKHRHLKSAR